MANDSHELWTISQAAKYLGIKSASARGQLSRWKIPRTYVPGDTGRPEARYDADAIRAAHAARPGRGHRTDLTHPIEGAAPMALPLLNTSIITTDGTYERRTITLQDALNLLEQHGGDVDSAIGHQATADILTVLLGVQVPVNRQHFTQQRGQAAVVLQLNGRPPEGTILDREQVEAIGYELKLLTRTS